jgi:ketosteroid isomerase-like protein
MKAFLTTLALAPALAVAAQSALPPAQQQLFETERAFVRAAAAKGFRDSFYEYFADDGIAFNPHPFRVRVSLANQPSTPPPMGANWAPVWGDIAAAGDLGWNTGPLLYPGRDGKPDRHGLFFSVWKRQADGKFKVVLDIGSDTPAAVVPIAEPPHSSWREGQGTPGGVDVDAANAELRAIEQAFLAESADAGIGRAYQRRLADEARVHRPGVMPVAGRVALGEWAGAQSGKYRGETLFADVSRSGELGYTWGSYERIGEVPDAGYFARVWKKEPRGEWRIVMDTVSPVPAGTQPLTAALMRAETPYLEGRWAEAEAAYREFVTAHPGNAFAWNRLGTSQVQQRRYSEAVKSLERAIAVGGGGAVDFYNLACAYALAGDADQALDSVERAIGAGLRRREQYETDPDLASLRELPRFRTLMESLGG